MLMHNMILKNSTSLGIVQYTVAKTSHCKDVTETDLRTKAFKLIVKRPENTLSNPLQFDFSKTRNVLINHF